jgi:hypothetical protein
MAHALMPQAKFSSNGITIYDMGYLGTSLTHYVGITEVCHFPYVLRSLSDSVLLFVSVDC